MLKTKDEIRTIVRAIHSDFIDTINSKRPDETVDAIKYIEDKLDDCDFDETTLETVEKQLHPAQCGQLKASFAKGGTVAPRNRGFLLSTMNTQEQRLHSNTCGASFRDDSVSSTEPA